MKNEKERAPLPPAHMMGRMLSSFTDCLCCWRGSRQYADLDDTAQPLNLFQTRAPATLDDLLEKTSRAREAVWQELGVLEPMFLSHLVNPALYLRWSCWSAPAPKHPTEACTRGCTQPARTVVGQLPFNATVLGFEAHPMRTARMCAVRVAGECLRYGYRRKQRQWIWLGVLHRDACK